MGFNYATNKGIAVYVHDELIFTIQKIYPSLIHGKDFWIGQPADGLIQKGAAFIVQWSNNFPQPTKAELEKVWIKYADEYTQMQIARCFRIIRYQYLLESDVHMTRALEQKNEEQIEKLKQFRQHLRDLPTTDEFPHEVRIPSPPYESKVNHEEVLRLQILFNQAPEHLFLGELKNGKLADESD